MTTTELALNDDKVRAEIAKLVAEAAHINALTVKSARETMFYPFVVGATTMAGLLTAGAGIATAAAAIMKWLA